MKRFRIGLFVAFMLASTSAFAQMTSMSSAGVKGGLVDQTQSGTNDPAAIDMLFKEGNTIISILDGLKEKGFHIEYKKKQVPPTMTLVALPKASRIDEVLTEILAPWNLRPYHSPDGRWIIRQVKDKSSAVAGAKSD
ncbi:MAG TPA: hypothetical protein VFS47_02935 [Steroidobacteraceae bacterium]|jgi:hypothetical protein|nr:hypothetical protein [Steroidobacteraceae bacterium]